MGLTIKGKAKEFKLAHESIKKSLRKGKEVVTPNGKFKVCDLSLKKAMVNVTIEVEVDNDNSGNVELKIYEPSMKKNKGATQELRTLPGYQCKHVDDGFIKKLKYITEELVFFS